MADFEYDDKNLQKLFDELEPKRRVQALRGAFRKEANRLKKAAIANLRSSIKSNRDLEKGVRTIVFKEKAGFRVTVGTKKGKGANGTGGYYANKYERTQKKRWPRRVPVLIWTEDGTNSRSTTQKVGRGRRSTDSLKASLFLERAQRDLSGSVTENLRKEIVNSIIKTSKKYGGK